MSEHPPSYLTDPAIAARLRRTADDLTVERQRAATASEGLEQDLRELADELAELAPFDADQTVGEAMGRADQGRLL